MAQRGVKFGVFLAPFHLLRDNPTLAMARDLELLEWLDHLGYDAGLRRASFRRLGDHCLARPRGGRTTYQARLGGHQPTLPPSVSGRATLCPARSHDARAGHAALRPRRAAVGLYARHR